MTVELDPLVELSLRNFSYSRIKTYRECKLRYFFAYILKVPQSFGMPATLGNILHRTIETATEEGEGIVNPKDLVQHYRLAIDEFDPDHRIPKSMIDEGTTMLGNFVKQQRPEPRKLEITKDFHLEMPFSEYIGGAKFNGYIDHIRVKDDAVIVTDYKCVVEGTEFWARDGSPLYVKELEAGSEILGYDLKSNKIVPVTVVAVEENGSVPVVQVTTHSGLVLNVSVNHPVMTPRRWVNAGDLQLDHEILVALNINNLDIGPPEPALPDPELMAEFIQHGPSESYKRYRRDLRVYDPIYWRELFALLFKNGEITFLTTEAKVDLKFMLAQLGIHAEIWTDTNRLSSNRSHARVLHKSRANLVHFLTGGTLNRTEHLVTDLVKSVRKTGYAETWAVTVEPEHVHITDGVVTHNSGKMEVAAKNVPSDLQLGIYSIVANRMFPGRSIYAQLYYLRSERKKGHQFAPDELKVIEDELAVSVGQIIDTTHYKPTQNKNACRWCSYAKDETCPTGAARMGKFSY